MARTDVTAEFHERTEDPPTRPAAVLPRHDAPAWLTQALTRLTDGNAAEQQGAEATEQAEDHADTAFSRAGKSSWRDTPKTAAMRACTSIEGTRTPVSILLRLCWLMPTTRARSS